MTASKFRNRIYIILGLAFLFTYTSSFSQDTAKSDTVSKEFNINASNRTIFSNNSFAVESGSISWTQYWIVPAIDFDFKENIYLHLNNMLHLGMIGAEVEYALPLSRFNSRFSIGIFGGQVFGRSDYDFGGSAQWTLGKRQKHVYINLKMPLDYQYFNNKPLITFGGQFIGDQDLMAYLEISKVNYLDYEAGSDTGDGEASFGMYAFGIGKLKRRFSWTFGIAAVQMETFNDVPIPPLIIPILKYNRQFGK